LLDSLLQEKIKTQITWVGLQMEDQNLANPVH